MKYIKSFNEALGVSTPTKFYLKKLTYIAIKEFYKMVDEKKSSKRTITINWKDIHPLILNYNEYKRFPVGEINIDISVEKQDDNITYAVGGFASQFNNVYRSSIIDSNLPDVIDHNLSLRMELDISYGKRFRKTGFHTIFENTRIYLDFESVISHELNHLYESYNKSLNNKLTKKNALSFTHATNQMVDLVDIDTYNFWYNNFTKHLYWTNEYEINAKVQEAYTYVNKLSFNAFKKTDYWTEADFMENWEPSILLNNIDIENLNVLKSELIRIYREASNSEYQKIDLYMTPDYLDKMDIIRFLEFFKKKLNSSGKILKRKYSRLYALKIKK